MREMPKQSDDLTRDQDEAQETKLGPKNSRPHTGPDQHRTSEGVSEPTGRAPASSITRSRKALHIPRP